MLSPGVGKLLAPEGTPQPARSGGSIGPSTRAVSAGSELRGARRHVGSAPVSWLKKRSEVIPTPGRLWDVQPGRSEWRRCRSLLSHAIRCGANPGPEKVPECGGDGES